MPPQLVVRPERGRSSAAATSASSIARKYLLHPEYGIRLVGVVDDQPLEQRDELDGRRAVATGTSCSSSCERAADRSRVVVRLLARLARADTLALIRHAARAERPDRPRAAALRGDAAERRRAFRRGASAAQPAPGAGSRARRGSSSARSTSSGPSLLLILTAPLFALLRLADQARLAGAVFFRQTRLGQDMKEFTALKFRTMTDAGHDGEHREYMKSIMSSRAIRRRERALQARARRRRHERRPLAAQDLARRAAAAAERAARRHVARRPAAVHPLRDRALRAASLRALPRARGHHRPLAGDGAVAMRRSSRRSTSTSPMRAAGRSDSTCACSPGRHSRSSATGARREPGPGRSRRARLLGTAARPQSLRVAARRARRRLRRARRRLWRRSGGAIPAVAQTTDFAEVLADPDDRGGRRRDADQHALSSSRGPRSTPASTRSSRSRSQARWRRRRALTALARGARPRADAGPHIPLQPAGAGDPRPDRVRRARRDLLRLHEPREPRPAPVRRERGLGPRPARLLDPLATGWTSRRSA